jgi:hypothetical protein
LPAGLGSPRPAANRRIERSFRRGVLMAYVYILASWRRLRYVGVTSNLPRRRGTAPIGVPGRLHGPLPRPSSGARRAL